MELFSKEEKERLGAILSSLPTLNPDIADPARHEKLLSFLQSHSDRGPRYVDFMIEEQHALQIVQDSLSHPDYRVPSIALRFLGYLVRNEPRVFEDVQTHYPQILDYVLLQLGTECAPQLRYACVEAVNLFLSAELAAKWLAECGTFPSIMLRSLLCPSLYVVTASSKLFVSVINHPAPRNGVPSLYHQLSAVLLVSGQLYPTMTRWLSGERPDGQFAALELVWALSTAHSEAAYRFLRDGALIQACCGLLANVDRIMRSRILDSLKAVFGWAPRPMALLRSNSDVTLGLSGINSSNEAFHHLAQLCLLPILKSEQRRGAYNILNAFDILDILAVLGNRAENPTLIAWILDLVVGSFNIAYPTDTLPITFSSADSSLSSMAEMFLQEVREALAPSSTHKRKMQTNLLLINVFSTLDYVVSTCSVSVQTFSSLFLVTTKALSIDDIAKDQKLFKEILCALSTMLKRCGKVEDIGSIVNALMACLKSAQMRAQNAKIALELVKYIMGDDAWCTVILVPELVETLRQLLQDARWDVRDSTLEFIGDMFDCNHDSISRPTVNLAINHSLPDAVLETMADPEPYVRSSCLAALKKITVNPRGHLYLSTHGKEHGLVRQLIASSSQDSDPLVRQSALDLLVYLVCDKRGDEMLFDLEHRLLNRDLMKQVMVDVDSEVRMRGVRLLSAIFNLDGGEEDRGTWFLEVGGNELIMDAITDGSRLVRQEAYKTVKDQMLPQLESFIALKGNKRDRMSDSATLRSFACELVLLDMDNLKESCAAEHLYQEVLDVDESVLREERPRGEGNNKLACYDC